MDMTNVIVNYRRFLKRRNYSARTVTSYMNILKHFVIWINVPIEEADYRILAKYTDYLLRKRLKPKTINCQLACIRVFYDYLYHEERIRVRNPVKRGSSLRMPRPLPKHLRDDEVLVLFKVIDKPRDRAIFKIMLRCGLRVEETANLQLRDLDLKRKRIFVRQGKGGKDRVVYVSRDAREAIIEYLRVRRSCKSKRIFLVEKGPSSGQPISVRGIQKRLEYYASLTSLKVSCHQLRHTMATQMLNAEAETTTIQELLGHSCSHTTERYCTVSNVKVMKDYFKAMDLVMKRAALMEMSRSHPR
jgi:site-specific recombinase XerD